MSRVKSCLIIDDDQDDRDIFLMCMNNVTGNIECMATGDPVKAISMLTTDNSYIPDYVFLDVNMPKMNGIECLKERKKIKRLKNSRILMYSTTSEPGVLAETKKFGADDFIVKPTKLAELREKLCTIFNTNI